MKGQAENVGAIAAPVTMSIRDFCRQAGISRAFFYKMNRLGKTPPILKLGTRSLIAADDVKAWRRDLQQRAAA
jgi:predicted DNA-binding transcriptional regulator AlpA